MRKLILTTISLATLFACTQTPKYSLDANIEGLTDQTVYLKQRGANGVVNVDSTTSAAGKFSFSGSVTVPEQYFIQAGEKLMIPLFIENGKIEITGKADDAKSVAITGSKVQAEYEAFKAEGTSLNNSMTELYAQYKEARKNNDAMKAGLLENQIDSIDQLINEQNKSFLAANGASFIAPAILQSVQYGMEADELNSYVSKFSPEVMQTKIAKSLAERVSLLQSVAIGQTAPEFTMNDSIGNPVKLSDIYSKHELTLIDFWASWCGPCRKENPNVVANFNQFKDKGFTVLGVSCDNNKEKWVKAVADDKLTWFHVSDLKGWGNEAAKLYGVNSIPSNLLVDKTGKIIAKNLREEKLGETLAQLLQ